MTRRLWTTKEDRLLRKLFPDNNTSDILLRFDRSYSSVSNRAYLLGLKKSEVFMKTVQSGRLVGGEVGRQFQFKKGQRPPNKGRRQKDWMPPESIEKTVKTRFKPGTVPPNRRPVGYERIDEDGYVYIKVAEGLKQFKLKHRVVWEKHNGAIPKGVNIQFKDGNRQNCDISNLYAIDRRRQMKDNSYHNWPKELANMVQLRGALNRQINKRLKHEK